MLGQGHAEPLRGRPVDCRRPARERIEKDHDKCYFEVLAVSPSCSVSLTFSLFLSILSLCSPFPSRSYFHFPSSVSLGFPITTSDLLFFHWFYCVSPHSHCDLFLTGVILSSFSFLFFFIFRFCQLPLPLFPSLQCVITLVPFFSLFLHLSFRLFLILSLFLHPSLLFLLLLFLRPEGDRRVTRAFAKFTSSVLSRPDLSWCLFMWHCSRGRSPVPLCFVFLAEYCCVSRVCGVFIGPLLACACGFMWVRVSV